MGLHRGLAVTLGVSLALLAVSPAFSAPPNVPGAADVGRVKPEERIAPVGPRRAGSIAIPRLAPADNMPPQAREVHLTLSSVVLKGVTAFTAEEMKALYAPYLNKSLTLDKVYELASVITRHYRDAGYFLSLAYVPNQKIRNGSVTIQVVEGQIEEVKLPEEVEDYAIAKAYAKRLTDERPVHANTLERFLLQMNDLPGYAFRAVLSPAGKMDSGKVLLTLLANPTEDRGYLSFDNNSSRYLGPNETLLSYTTDLLPFQRTTVAGLTSLPGDKLRYFTLSHTLPVAKDLTLELTGSLTDAHPGFTLASYDIASSAISMGATLTYQAIRQRQENLAFRLVFDGRNVTSDIIGAPLTRDRVRAVRLGVNYDTVDAWAGYDALNVVVSHGLRGFGASERGDLNLSRSDANPAFTKVEVNLSRTQQLGDAWILQSALAAQRSDGPLYSSEEFGYGGQVFGRAYDSSDITGNNGINGSLELRYNVPAALDWATFQPFGFYDIGKVWSDATGQPSQLSASSVGLGLRFTTKWQQSGLIGFAWPLTRDISAPIYGGGTKGPRFLLQMNQNF